jgi:hypothetical protein
VPDAHRSLESGLNEPRGGADRASSAECTIPREHEPPEFSRSPAYANFGLYPVRPDTPSLNYFAVTKSNVAGGAAFVSRRPAVRSSRDFLNDNDERRWDCARGAGLW